MTLTTYILIACCIINLAVLIVNAFVWHKANELNGNIKSYFEVYTEIAKENNKIEKMFYDINNSIYEQYKLIKQQYKLIKQQYKLIKQQYDLIIKSNNLIFEEYKDLLKDIQNVEAEWKELEERYSDVYEMFAEMKHDIELVPDDVVLKLTEKKEEQDRDVEWDWDWDTGYSKARNKVIIEHPDNFQSALWSPSMNHDACHCSDFNPDICTEACRRARLTQEYRDNPDFFSDIPVSFASFRGIEGECPLTEEKEE